MLVALTCSRTTSPHASFASVVLITMNYASLLRPGNASVLRFSCDIHGDVLSSPSRLFNLVELHNLRERDSARLHCQLLHLDIWAPLLLHVAIPSTSFDKSSPGSVPICSSIREAQFSWQKLIINIMSNKNLWKFLPLPVLSLASCGYTCHAIRSLNWSLRPIDNNIRNSSIRSSRISILAPPPTISPTPSDGGQRDQWM
jgi:hypothetical protein